MKDVAITGPCTKLLGDNGIEVQPLELSSFHHIYPPGVAFDNLENPIQDPYSNGPWTRVLSFRCALNWGFSLSKTGLVMGCSLSLLHTTQDCITLAPAN